MSYFSQAAITIWRWICWCVVTLCLAIASVPASFALAVYIALDFLPKKGSKPSTSPKPIQRKLQIPARRGSDVYVIEPDGTEIPLEPLAAARQAQMWNEVVSGAYVAQKTKL